MMHNSDILREQAARYRQQAQAERDAAEAAELRELAEVCETVALEIDDLRHGG